MIMATLSRPNQPPLYSSQYQNPSAMVSRPTLPPSDPPPSSHRALSIRGPASVSARTHGTRRHHRSQRSGSYPLPQNEFPVFSHTGDVEIVIASPDGGQEKKYLLHRLILAQCSGFFEAGMSEEWERSGIGSQGGENGQEGERSLARVEEDGDEVMSPGSVIGGRGGSMDSTRSAVTGGVVGRKRWRYELDWDNKEEEEEPILIQKPPSTTLFGGISTTDLPSYPQPALSQSRSKQPHHTSFFRSVANLALPSHHANQTAIHLPSTSQSTYAPSHAQNPANDIPDEQLHPTLHTYHNLFLVYYNHAPNISPTNLPAAYTECKSLLTLADMYDSLAVIGPKVEHALLRFSSRLFKQIAKYPPSYLKLGYLARSRVIFAEALIHVVGQWPLALPHLRHPSSPLLPDTILDLIEDKADELEDAKAKIEAKLFRLTLTTSRGERVTPQNAYLDWLALSLFRQWLAENTTPPPAPILKHPTSTSNSSPSSRTNHNLHPPSSQNPTAGPTPSSPTASNTGRLYRQVGSSNREAYLTHDELKKFLKINPEQYSRDNLRRFERKVDEIKNLARDVVKPLMRNFLEVDMRTESGGGLPYLTCTKVEDEDLPWD